MPIDVNSTAQLLGAYGVMDRPAPVLLNLFFTTEQAFDTEEVYFDKVQRARRLAPFVVPTVAGKPDRSRGYNTTSLRPPYVKPKHAIEPIKALKRRPGERLLGELSPKQRFDLALIDNMQLEDDEITRREEWMATQLLLSGAMVCSGDGFPTVTVDLGRNAAHTVQLTNAATWGSTGVDPLTNLRTWGTTVQKNSGFHPGTVVMDPLAADAFIKSSGVAQIMNTFRQTSGNIDLGGKVVGGVGREAKYLGDTGEFQVWVYQQYYTDDSGNVSQLMPDNTVIMGNPAGAQGVRTYGAIQDADAGITALPRFPKVWKENDPSVWMSMTQSAPLPIFGWVDATFAATVH